MSNQNVVKWNTFENIRKCVDDAHLAHQNLPDVLLYGRSSDAIKAQKFANDLVKFLQGNAFYAKERSNAALCICTVLDEMLNVIAQCDHIRYNKEIVGQVDDS